MAIPSRIYLTGFMAAGKSTVGRILANTIGYEFIDLDHYIVNQEGQSVVDLFKTRGEVAFRQLETDALEALNSRQQLVISLGGGTVCYNDNLNRIRHQGLLIYLKVRPKQLLYRIRAKRDRPLFLDTQGNLLPDAEIRAKINQMMKERCPFYEQANLTVESDEQPVGLVVDWIKLTLECWSPDSDGLIISPITRRKRYRPHQ